MNNLTIEVLKNKQIEHALQDIALLRLKVFKEYPYLYDGDMDYEKKYLNTYLQCDASICVIVKDQDKIVGVSTAIPLEYATIECQTPFLEHQFSLQDIFYLGESVLLPSYRNRSIYRYFFAKREQAALEYGCKITAFCTVMRDNSDKRRPKNYCSLDTVWRHFGYKHHPELIAQYEWKEIGETVPTCKPMMFWIKHLATPLTLT